MKNKSIKWWLIAILILCMIITACLPWGKKKDEGGLYEKGKEGRWVYSERQPSSAGEEKSAVSYSKKPYESVEDKNIETERRKDITAKYIWGKLKYRIVLTEFRDMTKEGRKLKEVVAQELARQLEESGAVVIIELESVKKYVGKDDQQYIMEPSTLWRLKTLLGVQGVVTGVITDVLVGSKKEGSVNEEAIAIAKIETKLLDTETGNVIKTVKGENPIYTSRTTGEFSNDKALSKAVNFALNEVSEGIIRGLSSLEWSSSVASSEGEKVYINAGKESGLKVGDILEVFSPGKEIRHSMTNVSLGRTPGKLKGTIKIQQFFGIDVSESISVNSNEKIVPGDIVRIAQ